jgi:thiamine pyrophosphokinase
LESKRVVCLGLLGGRFDQEMCNLSTLQKYALKHKETNFIAAGKYALICVVKPNIKTIIRVGKAFAKKHCGLTCFGKAKVQTQGLKWELGHGGPEEL